VWARLRVGLCQGRVEPGEARGVVVLRPRSASLLHGVCGSYGSGRWYAADPRHAARPCETSFSPKLLAAVAKVRGTIATTIYPPTREVASRRKKRVRWQLADPSARRPRGK